jgi:hypothetical protein
MRLRTGYPMDIAHAKGASVRGEHCDRRVMSGEFPNTDTIIELAIRGG